MNLPADGTTPAICGYDSPILTYCYDCSFVSDVNCLLIHTDRLLLSGENLKTLCLGTYNTSQKYFSKKILVMIFPNHKYAALKFFQNMEQ